MGTLARRLLHVAQAMQGKFEHQTIRYQPIMPTTEYLEVIRKRAEQAAIHSLYMFLTQHAKAVGQSRLELNICARSAAWKYHNEHWSPLENFGLTEQYVTALFETWLESFHPSMVDVHGTQ